MHPKDLLYSTDHVWCKNEPDGNIRLGITYYYQEKLKHIVYLDLPQSNTKITKGDSLASFESSKIATDLVSPISGTVVESHNALAEKPGVVNKDPYGEGWILLINPNLPTECDTLLSAQQYIDLILK
jgi:glycine cleavage system H protein